MKCIVIHDNAHCSNKSIKFTENIPIYLILPQIRLYMHEGCAVKHAKFNVKCRAKLYFVSLKHSCSISEGMYFVSVAASLINTEIKDSRVLLLDSVRY